MKLKVFTVGKLSLKPVGALSEEYLGRIQHYLPIEITNLKSSEDFFSKLAAQDYLIALDERGKTFSSTEFAKWLEDQKLRSVKNLVFFVGPAGGVPEEIKKRANLLLSLSTMTLQHELALVVLLEQIYRACTILKGEPYHK
ncbi:MAG: hypothetical protein A2W61_02235 [Deltaproteobacteria bacterium RIFCSPLOWO2_01_44_7]|nr:MAG: hypothetical protein A2712_05265 [Deltaproteobacteria bacterium RIFCSPHIGHO2_01_FULL_43_49]OGQ14388.1 MAG: hypothetical protein A3D22_05120 [Deltaproteobacteria bacterium RIFCSPHIGHO2_02_FULL_44_53]OGQ27572.1 MAG: hypothetical protein A3D98_09055 [Deltaproteobacteria bacterium RIFCSPHIGHO2_12_FULL_44_21]OGQ30829.1 MAG: hypothetical protein A2979_01530 [Deltaproteobacteria bacterium RIFCSPLOWO2_01_FULL_45_74]OGQ37495.1 MAG: hypothetical protein A2W61_02235 [Deltaproteobacteria bacterium 